MDQITSNHKIKRNRMLNRLDVKTVDSAKPKHKLYRLYDGEDRNGTGYNRTTFLPERLHMMFADYVENSLPNPHLLNISGAKEHHFTAVRNLFTEFKNCKIIADKAYVDGELKNDLAAKDIQLHTPIKLTKTKKNSQKKNLSIRKSSILFGSTLKFFSVGSLQ